jgi:uncharacterized membrane protein
MNIVYRTGLGIADTINERMMITSQWNNMTRNENVANDLWELWILILVHVSIMFSLYAILISGIDLTIPLEQDVTIYYEKSLLIMQGKCPYIDFKFEYPPLALIPMILPHLFATDKLLSYPIYLHVFAGENCLYSVLIMLVLAMIARRVQSRPAVIRVLIVYITIMIFLSPLLFWRYDIFPAALSIICLYAVLWKRANTAGILVGLGFAAKLYSVVLLPVMLAYYTARREWRNVLSIFCASSAAVVFIFIPFLFAGPNALLNLIRYHHDRGLQLESVAGGMVVMLDSVGITKATVGYSYGAWHVASPIADIFLNFLPIMLALALGAVMLCCFIHFEHRDRLHGAGDILDLNAYFAMAILALLVFSNVFSPQFLIWLLPFSVLLPLRQALTLLAISMITIGLVTQCIYQPLTECQFFAALLLNLRNMLVILLALSLMKSVGPKWEIAAIRSRLIKIVSS